MKKSWFIFALLSIILGTTSCSKDEGEGGSIEEADLIGTWVASSGKYNLSMEISSSGYDFLISEPGRGGVTDKGTYEISDDGKIAFVSKQGNPLATGQLKNGELSLTFVSSIMIGMLGTGPASHMTFTLSDEEPGGDDGLGYLVVENDSGSYDIVAFKFYDKNGKLLDSDTDVLEPGYYVTYEVPTGTYSLELTDDRSQKFKSKSFKIIKDKATVLTYNGSTLEVTATGIDPE